MSPDIEVSLSAIEALVAKALRNVGASDYECDVVVAALIAADLRGQHGHGISRLPALVSRVRAGLIVPGSLSTFVQAGPSMAVLDGNFGFGHVTAIDACHRGSEMARQTGVGVVLVRHSNHVGMLAHYLERLARTGVAAILLTTTEAAVRPAGGSRPLLGVNPIGIAFPADPPFVLDMSTAATTIGKLNHALVLGETIPESWAVDESGHPTGDPAAALRGALNPFGGVKGYGLALAVALLAGPLTGTSTGPRVQGVLDSGRVATNGTLFIVIDPRRLPWGDEVSSRATAYLAELRRSQPVDPAQPVLVPGDRGRSRALLLRSHGRLHIPLRLWTTLTELAHDPFD